MQRTIFILHADKDEEFLNEIEKQLSPIAKISHLNKIPPSSDREKYQRKFIETADIIIPLLSSDFFAEDTIRKLLEIAWEEHNSKIIPILIRGCLWEYSLIKDLQILPKDGKPINEHDKRDTIYRKIAIEIKSQLEASPSKSNIPTIFSECKNTTSKLLLFPYPFSEPFILELISSEDWQLFKAPRNVLHNSGEFWQIHEQWLPYLQKNFSIIDKQLKEFAQKCLFVYNNQNIFITECINTLNVLLLYIERFKSKKIIRSAFRIFQDIDISHIKQHGYIKPILHKIENYIESKEINDIEKANVYQKLANDFGKLNYRLDKAIFLGEQALEIQQKLKGEESLEAASSVETLALIYYLKGDFQTSFRHYQKVLSTRKELLPEDHFDFAVLYLRMSNPCNRLDKFEEAESYLENALEILMYQPDSEQKKRLLSHVYNNLIALYQRKGNYDILEFCSKAIALKEEIYGTDSPQTAKTYNQVANVYYNRGDYDNALKYYLLVKEIYLKSLSKNHPYTISTFNNLATTYRAKKMFEEAKKLFAEILQYLNEHIHEESHIFYTEMGRYHLDLKEPEQAEVFFQRSLHHTVFGGTNINLAHHLDNIASIYQEQSKFEIALELFEESLELKKQLLEENHPYIADTLLKIGEVKKSMGKYDEALDYLNQVLLIREQKMGRENTQTARIYNLIANTSYLKKDYLQSTNYYKKALKVYKNPSKIDKKSVVTIHTKIINNHIKFNKLQIKDFAKFLKALLKFLKLYPSLTSEVIAFFKQENTFNEELAKEILAFVPFKTEFKTFMQKHFELLL